MVARSVLIVHDESLLFRLVRNSLDAVHEVKVVGEACDFLSADRLARQLQPDAILAGRRVNGLPAVEFFARLRPVLPLATFVILGDDHRPEELLRMEEIGVSGYLVATALREALLPHVLAAATDEHIVILTDAAARALMTAERQRLGHSDPAPALTDRQRAVLHHLTEELTVTEIAHVLGTSNETVKREIVRLEELFGVHSRFALGVKAARAGLVP